MGMLQRFIKLEAAAGLVLIAAAGVAMVCANSPLAGLYDAGLETQFEVRLGKMGLSKPLILWINDGLMAIFFLLVALELKREVLEGELSNWDQVALPLAGSIGGILVPAAVYLAFNAGSDGHPQGWAIPAATDIAFALGILSLLGDRVPKGLKTFLLTLAVFDDVGAIIIIAVFYGGQISWAAKGLALVTLGVLILLNQFGVTRLGLYLLVGVFLWVVVLKSGVHATLAGVLLGLTIPLRKKNASGESPLRRLERILHPWVAFLILPIFAFANAGVSLTELSSDDLFHPVALGIFAALLAGKTFGVFGVSMLLPTFGWAKLPEGSTRLSLFGISVLSGIGFTMSLFIGSLAFEATWNDMGTVVRLGVLGGSLVAAVTGFTVLRFALGRRVPHRF